VNRLSVRAAKDGFIHDITDAMLQAVRHAALAEMELRKRPSPRRRRPIHRSRPPDLLRERKRATPTVAPAHDEPLD
jgi:hypothetical protein